MGRSRARPPVVDDVRGAPPMIPSWKAAVSFRRGSGSLGTSAAEELAQRLPAFARVPDEQALGRHRRLDLVVPALHHGRETLVAVRLVRRARLCARPSSSAFISGDVALATAGRAARAPRRCGAAPSPRGRCPRPSRACCSPIPRARARSAAPWRRGSARSARGSSAPRASRRSSAALPKIASQSGSPPAAASHSGRPPSRSASRSRMW